MVSDAAHSVLPDIFHSSVSLALDDGCAVHRRVRPAAIELWCTMAHLTRCGRGGLLDWLAVCAGHVGGCKRGWVGAVWFFGGHRRYTR